MKKKVRPTFNIKRGWRCVLNLPWPVSTLLKDLIRWISMFSSISLLRMSTALHLVDVLFSRVEGDNFVLNIFEFRNLCWMKAFVSKSSLTLIFQSSWWGIRFYGKIIHTNAKVILNKIKTAKHCGTCRIHGIVMSAMLLVTENIKRTARTENSMYIFPFWFCYKLMMWGWVSFVSRKINKHYTTGFDSCLMSHY